MAITKKTAREIGRKGGLKSAAMRREKMAQRVMSDEPTALNVIDAMEDPRLFGEQFSGESWATWKVFLKGVFALPMTAEELEVFKRYTGNREPPEKPVGECWAICGRRGGKTIVSALVASFLATCRDYTGVLVPGELGVVLCLASDRRQARVTYNYIQGLFNSVPALKELVTVERRESMDLATGLTIEVATADYRLVRGRTVVAAILDEAAFWRSDDSASPDVEVVRALRPSMLTIDNAVMMGISTPYSRRGVLWSAFEKHFGVDSPTLVWRAPTVAMNPRVDPKVIDAALEEDPASGRAEYLAEFRSDVESFISPEAIQAVTVYDRLELPKIDGVTHHAFADPSGGSQDSFTLAIAHAEGEKVVLDLTREVRPPFSPESVVKEFAEVLKSYGLSRVTGDRYAGAWCSDSFAKFGVDYRPSEKVKSDIYVSLLPLINSGRCELLDSKRLRAQLEGLERRVARGGKDSVDHGPGGRDDLCNAAGGALVLCAAKKAPLDVGGFSVRGESYFKGIDRGPSRYGSGAFYRTGLE